jgi:hypothetical protein
MLPKGNIKDWGSIIQEEKKQEEIIPIKKTSFIKRKRYVRIPKAK